MFETSHFPPFPARARKTATTQTRYGTLILHEIDSISTEFDETFYMDFLFSMRIAGDRPRRDTNVKT